MNIRTLLTILLGFMLWASVSAQECKRFEFQGKHNQMWYLDAFFGFHFGNTSYTRDALPNYNGMPENLKSLKRELLFPLDVSMTGLSLKGPFCLIKGRPGQFMAYFATNIQDPFHRMTEKVWKDETMKSFVHYDPNLQFFDSSIKYDFQLFNSHRSVLELSTQFSLQYIQQDMIAYGGWVTDSESGLELDVKELQQFLIDYRLSYLSVESGVSYHYFPNKIIQFVLDPHAGIIYAKDRDKHFHELRVTDASSYGFIFGIDLHCIIQPKLLQNFSIFYRSGFSYNSGTGKQTESWFKDGPNVKAGTVFEGITQTTTSLQYHFILGIGYSFISIE